MTSSIVLLLVSLCISGIAGYTVTGNKIYDPNGNQVLLRGVDRPSFEWSVTGEQASASDYVLMRGWGANVVRIATNQDFWLSSSTGSEYQANIAQQITWATAAGMGVILDLHWNNGGQQTMADLNSITYWSQVAAIYKNNAWVMFELYNEPHDITWAQWLNGDSTNNIAGMQQLYNAVRAAGAENTVLVGGLNWAFDLSGVGAGYAVQGTNIAYATHPYDYAGKQIADWPAAFGYLVSTSPVVMTEFGQYCNTDTYVSDLLTYAQTNNIHWTAWGWYVSGCAFPSIISDWNGTPISGVGVLVKSYLSGMAPTASASNPSLPTTPPAGASSALTVYSDSLASGWQDWSWASQYSLSSTTYVHSGTSSIMFVVQGYQGIYLHTTTAFTLGSYAALQFYVNGGLSAISSSALSVRVYGTSDGVVGNAVNFPASVPASQWSLISIPISSFGVASSTQITGFTIAANADANAGTLYVDDISFTPAASSTSAPTTAAPTQKPTSAPTSAPTAAPTQKPTSAPTQKPTTAPTQKPTSAPTQKPTTAPTTAPTHAPTTAPTTAPTHAPTTAPTHAPTTAPTHAPTTAPTTAPTHAPTAAPTHQPTTAPSTPAPSAGCSASSVQLTQTAVGSWPGSNGQTVTQYNVVVSTTCTGKALTGLTLAASNWNSIDFWNAIATSSAAGQATLTLPSWASVTPSNPLTIGYQNVGGQASLTITSATFQ